MKKWILLLFWITVLAIMISITGTCVEFQLQKQNMIRFHVVGASDDPRDQEMKLLVRDAVQSLIEMDIQKLEDADAVEVYLQNSLRRIEAEANRVLQNSGSTNRASIGLCREAFPAREYDTFTLPSGVYTSLSIRIGEAEGKNWWCVVFPSLCYSATEDGFVQTASYAGFSQPLQKTLTRDEKYQIRFFVLDCIGKLENFFHFR